jgi:hypothetical protein
MEWQTFVALSLVALSAVYVGYRVWQSVQGWSGNRTTQSGCGGCQGCSFNRPSSEPVVVTLQRPK